MVVRFNSYFTYLQVSLDKYVVSSTFNSVILPTNYYSIVYPIEKNTRPLSFFRTASVTSFPTTGNS